MSEVIVLISIASDIAPQKGIWQEYYWNLLFDTLSPLTNISQAQYNKCGWWSFIFLAKSLVLPLVEAVAWFPNKKKKQLSVTQDKFTSNIFTPKFAEKRPKANGMEISSIVYRKSKKFRCNKIS